MWRVDILRTSLSLLLLFFTATAARSQEEISPPTQLFSRTEIEEQLQKDLQSAFISADSAWMMISTALVMLMVPGLALFYGGMVRRKNILATMMHSTAALAVVGVYWVAIGYSLAFGHPWLGRPDFSFLGFSKSLILLHGIAPGDLLPGTHLPVYLHCLYQGMFAIITPALISGAVAERIRFKPYCLFLLAWVTLVYCPLAHGVWALDWWHVAPLSLEKGVGGTPCGWLGALGALDFAGGTVVHISAGFAGLAAIIVLRKRHGYPEQSFHPSGMVLTLTGAGLLWFGWFGFNGGSALASGANAVSAFTATQLAAAAAGLSWMAAESLHRGKATALGLASGIVAGLVAVTPASGFVYPAGGLLIGLTAGLVCYIAVSLKPIFLYDDSLDAFGVHGIGGFLGAILTGVFCSSAVNAAGADGALHGNPGQIIKQMAAAVAAASISLLLTIILVRLIDLVFGFLASKEQEIEGLDRTEHGETGFDLGLALEAISSAAAIEPRAATSPPNGQMRFQVVVEGVPNGDLMKAWSDLCQPGAASIDFKTVYPNLTTVQGNRFQFRGGDQAKIRDSLQRLFQNRLQIPVKAKVEG